MLVPYAQVVQGLQPSVLPPLREAYCASLNALLRRELRAVAAQLRRNGPEAGVAGSKVGSTGSSCYWVSSWMVTLARCVKSEVRAVAAQLR